MTSDQKEFPTADERLRAVPLPEPPSKALREERDRARRDRFFVILASMAAALGLIGAVVALSGREEAVERSANNAEAAARAEAKASAAADQAQGATDAAKEANRRLAAMGKPTVPVPTITTPPAPPPVQVEGLSGSQTSAVRAIIATELVAHHPQLTTAQIQQISRTAASMVPKPADGKTPTAAQLQPLIKTSVDAFCAGNRCQGKPGVSVTGPPGRPGDTVTGPAGKDAPPVTDEQLKPLISAMFTAYCAQDGQPCRGAAGEQGLQGPKGDTGQDGRSIVDTDCVGDGRESFWRITFDRPDRSGNTTTDELGPCRVSLPLPSEAARTK